MKGRSISLASKTVSASALAVLLAFGAAPAAAQEQGAGDPFALDSGLEQGRPQPGDGRTASLNGTELGERREAEDLVRINPTARVESRIPNRVENRLRTRIDRNYNPRASTTSSFEIASALTRRAGRAAGAARRR